MTKVQNARKDSGGASAAHGFALIRIIFGLVYVSNAVAKLTQVSDVRLGPIAGTLITRDGARGILERATNDTWFPMLGDIYRDIALANWGFFA